MIFSASIPKFDRGWVFFSGSFFPSLYFPYPSFKKQQPNNAAALALSSDAVWCAGESVLADTEARSDGISTPFPNQLLALALTQRSQIAGAYAQERAMEPRASQLSRPAWWQPACLHVWVFWPQHFSGLKFGGSCLAPSCLGRGVWGRGRWKGRWWSRGRRVVVG